MWYMLFVGIVAMFLGTFGLRCIIFHFYKKDVAPNCVAKKFVLDSFLWLISPDYSWAREAKDKIKALFPDNDPPAETPKQKDKAAEARGKYITIANTINLIVSVFLCAAVVALRLLIKNEGLYYSLFGFIGYRFFSRTIEINVAFFKDCLDRKKFSDLDKYDRIKLAFKSLLEEAFLFTAVYLFAEPDLGAAVLGGMHSFVLSPFSPDFVFSPFFKFVAVYQVICTVVLLTISFATYISTSDQPSDDKGDAKNGETGKTDKPGEISETDKPDETE